MQVFCPRRHVNWVFGGLVVILLCFGIGEVFSLFSIGVCVVLSWGSYSINVVCGGLEYICGVYHFMGQGCLGFVVYILCCDCSCFRGGAR